MEEIKLNNTEEFIKDCIDNSEVDIDTSYCDEIKFKFQNDEKCADDIDLLTSETNAKAFKLIFPNANVNLD